MKFMDCAMTFYGVSIASAKINETRGFTLGSDS